MPRSYSVILRPADRRTPLPSPRSCHAMARSWLDSPPGDECGGTRGAYSVGRPVRVGATVRVPINLVNDDLGPVLLRRAVPGPLWYTGATGDVTADPGWHIDSVRLDQTLDFEEVTTVRGRTTWRIVHLSAATRQQRGTWYTCDVDALTIMSRPIAVMGDVFGGVLALDRLLSQVLVTDHALSSRVFHPVVGARAQRLTVSGCLGWRRWRVQDPDAAVLVDAALRLAAYTGVGHLTSYGLGQVDVEALA